MPAFRMFLVAAAGTLMALFAAPLAASPAPAGASTITSPPLVVPPRSGPTHAAAATGSNQLNAMSCTSSTFCVAVGEQNVGAGGGTFTEKWNGTAWSVVPSVNRRRPQTTAWPRCRASARPSASRSAASGQGPGGGDVERQGVDTRLRRPAHRAARAPPELGLVRRPRCARCSDRPSAGARTRSSGTNGTARAVGHDRRDAGGRRRTTVSASGMSCVTASWCLAVGATDSVPDRGRPSARCGTGRPGRSSRPRRRPRRSAARCRRVSCAGVDFCRRSARPTCLPAHQNLTETWNGTTGRSRPARTLRFAEPGPERVSCFSATTCSAVGQAAATTGPSPATLALTWNGTAWAIVPNTPNGGTGRPTSPACPA